MLGEASEANHCQGGKRAEHDTVLVVQYTAEMAPPKEELSAWTSMLQGRLQSGWISSACESICSRYARSVRCVHLSLRALLILLLSRLILWLEHRKNGYFM